MIRYEREKMLAAFDEEPAATLSELLIEHGPAEVVEHLRKAARHHAWRPETATTFDRDVSAAIETALAPLAGKIWTGEPIFDPQKASETEGPSDEDPDRPEPFATVLELIGEHGTPEVLRNISDAALFDSEDEKYSHHCRVKSARLHLELEQLLTRANGPL